VITPGTLMRLFKMEARAARGAFDKLQNAEALLRAESLLDPWHAGTRSRWTRLLAQQGIRIEGSLPNTIKVTRDATSVSAWETDPGLEQEQSLTHRRAG
jgi:hypothetical protein